LFIVLLNAIMLNAVMLNGPEPIKDQLQWRSWKNTGLPILSFEFSNQTSAGAVKN
jgi:hypothetical protein